MVMERKNRNVTETSPRGCVDVLCRMLLFLEFISEWTFVTQMEINVNKMCAKYFHVLAQEGRKRKTVHKTENVCCLVIVQWIMYFLFGPRL